MVTVEVPSDSRVAPLWPALTVPAAAVSEWVALQLALRSGSTPCQVEPELWFAGRRSPAEAARQDAAREACAWCPVREACGAYAAAAGEPAGVWGGLTSGERKVRRV